ncbi:Proteasome subunit alpha type-7 [Diplonema papillatum]|nr:Proteasome subunit alpha type-7 [Diplonema papillatum]
MSYDRALTVFSPDGNLKQIGHAMEAVKMGAGSIGVQGKDSLVLCVQRKTATQLQDSRTVKKILKIDDHIFLAFSGLAADARVLAGRARNECQSFNLNYEDKVDVAYLARFIAHTQQRYTQSGGRRPFGVSAIIAGIDENGKANLYMTDPSGSYARWHAVACGPNQETVRTYLEQHYQHDMDDNATLRLAVTALMEVVDQGARKIEILQMKRGQPAHFLTNEETEELVKSIQAEMEAEEAKNTK